MATYAEKLRDPRWQKLRLEVFERDNWTCTECGSKETTLHVHHKEYVWGRDPWEYDPIVLTTLCEECHGLVTMLIKSIKESLGYMDATALAILEGIALGMTVGVRQSTLDILIPALRERGFPG